MKPLARADLMDLAQYELAREDFRRHTIEVKKPRRIAVGDLVTFVFENRDTLLFQVQEMIRAERIVREEAIQAELDVYNELMPSGRDLSATCFIEVTEKERIKEVLDRFLGLDAPGAVRLRLGSGRVIDVAFEEGRSEADRISAVHYVRFPFERADIEWWRSGEGKASLAIELPTYGRVAEIPPETRAALAKDFD